MAIQDKFNKENHIYKITKDIDLNEGTLTIPANCTLDFQGGSITNGNIIFNLTKFINPNFSNCRFSGSIKEKIVNIVDFGCKTGTDFDNSDIIQDLILLSNYSTNETKRDKIIYVPVGTYHISKHININPTWDSTVIIEGAGASSIICQDTDNTYIFCLYEYCGIRNITLTYKNQQTYDDIKSIALAAYRCVYSTFENIRITKCYTGIGHIAEDDKADENFIAMQHNDNGSYVNCTFQNIQILNFVGYAINHYAPGHGQSGSYYTNIYLGGNNDSPCLGFIKTIGALMEIGEINFEGKCKGVFCDLGLFSTVHINSVHIEGTSYKNYAFTITNAILTIDNIHLDRMDVTQNYSSFFRYAGIGTINIGTINTGNQLDSFTAEKCFLLLNDYDSNRANFNLNYFLGKNNFTNFLHDTYNNINIKLNFNNSGKTNKRPTFWRYKGMQYYDTDLKKMILWNGTSWVNLDGTALVEAANEE